ncbi:MAG: DUF1573 domain-containing protein [Planctomycetes bacterium]|nr:DUF1573 domain-containing protein [Planctomycetota bacterium]
MFRYSLVFLAGLWTAGAASASWADSLFGELSKDFGSVPHGVTLVHEFRLTNNTPQPLHIADVRVSCGCTTASALEKEVAPGHATAILAQMDTRRFTGVRAVTIFVDFDQPSWDEVRLTVQANSRDDVLLTPETLAFGRVRAGKTSSASVTVSFVGNNQAQILAAGCNSNYVKTSFKELNHGENEVRYQVSAQVAPDTPSGDWYSEVWLTTNQPSTPRLRVPLTVVVEAPLTVTPASLDWGQVMKGESSERRIIVRGSQPFRIKQVKGTDEVLSVRESSQGARQVHVLLVSLKPVSPGEVNRSLQVVTDLSGEGSIDFQVRAQVTP